MTNREKLIKLRDRALKAELPLKSGATKLVFGAGNPNAEILFIGEGPGYWEDVKGIPFVGNAGMLLNQTLARYGLKREDVFITNVVMYRPPENRDPSEEEIKAFEPFLDGIIETLKPKVICTLGRYSMAKFLPNVFISQVHGKAGKIKWKDLSFIVIPMYHPAAALRNGSVKEKFIDDFSILPKIQKGDEISENEEKDGSMKVKEKKDSQMSLI